MTTEELTQHVVALVGIVDRGGKDSVAVVADRLRELGIVNGVHVGRDDLVNGTYDCVEWYAGQLLAIIEGKHWFAMNSLINVCEKFTGYRPDGSKTVDLVKTGDGS